MKHYVECLSDAAVIGGEAVGVATRAEGLLGDVAGLIAKVTALEEAAGEEQGSLQQTLQNVEAVAAACAKESAVALGEQMASLEVKLGALEQAAADEADTAARAALEQAASDHNSSVELSEQIQSLVRKLLVLDAIFVKVGDLEGAIGFGRQMHATQGTAQVLGATEPSSQLASAARVIFSEADYTGDGTLSKSEIKKHIQKNPKLRAQLVGGSWAQFFEQVDTSGNRAAFLLYVLC